MGPPGVVLPGLVTVTVTLPAVATAEAGIGTVSWFAAGRVVPVCATPFQFTMALALKVLPLTVKVNLDRRDSQCWARLLLWLAQVRPAGARSSWTKGNYIHHTRTTVLRATKPGISS